jgi:hypothetical protein
MAAFAARYRAEGEARLEEVRAALAMPGGKVRAS